MKRFSVISTIALCGVLSVHAQSAEEIRPVSVLKKASSAEFVGEFRFGAVTLLTRIM